MLGSLSRPGKGYVLAGSSTLPKNRAVTIYTTKLFFSQAIEPV